MYDICDFIVVGQGGVPKGFSSPTDAVHHYIKRAPLWNVDPDDFNSMVMRLAHGEELKHSWDGPDSSPSATVAIMNTQERPLEDFANAHLWQWPASHKYLQLTLEAWELRTGPRVGDYCERPGEDRIFHRTYSRFTHDGGDYIQTGGGAGSYNIGKHGFASYSGGLDHGVQKDDLVDTGKRRWAHFWFFKDGWAGAHRGVDIILPVRVYAEVESCPS